MLMEKKVSLKLISQSFIYFDMSKSVVPSIQNLLTAQNVNIFATFRRGR